MTGQQLRNSILQEAIHGRLVPNVLQPGEKSARELLEDILAMRQKEENERKGKKAKKLKLSEVEEDPWELPEGWCWCKIQDLFDHSAGKAQNSSKKEAGKVYPYLTTSNVYWEGVDFTKVKEMAFSEEEYVKCSAIKGDLLVCEGGDVGRSCIWNYDYRIGLQNHIHRLRPLGGINVKFYYYVMMFFKNVGIVAGKGIGITGLSAGVLKDTVIPIAPISIQQAIVLKLESLFPLIDEYDTAQSELNALNETLPEKIRKSVLQDAIHGRLVPNVLQSGEKTAQELIQDILAQRQKAEIEAKGKKAKKISLCEIEEKPWELPEGWCWCKLRDIVDFSNSGSTKNSEISPDSWILDLEDIEKESGRLLCKKRFADVQSKSDKRAFKSGNVLYSKLRPYLNKCIIADENGYSTTEILAFDFMCIYNKYAQAFLMSPYFVDRVNQGAAGIKMPRVNNKEANDTCFPVPPLSIQYAIVSKIEEVFKLLEK